MKREAWRHYLEIKLRVNEMIKSNINKNKRKN
jgi:hypothetical protein